MKYIYFILTTLLILGVVVFMPAQNPILTNSWDFNSATAGVSVNIANRPINYHNFNWSVQRGMLSACTLVFESSANNSVWVTQSTGDCTTTGNATINFVANYIRVRISTFTVSSSPAVVIVNWSGYTFVPSGLRSDGSLVINSPLLVTGGVGKQVSVAHDGTNGNITLIGSGILNLGGTNAVTKLITSLNPPAFSNNGEAWIECQGVLGVGAGRICALKVNDTTNGQGVYTAQIQRNNSFYDSSGTVSSTSYTSGSFTAPTGQNSSYLANCNVDVFSGTSYTFQCGIAYTNENNVAVTADHSQFDFARPDGSDVNNISNLIGAGSYSGHTLYIRVKAGTSVSFSTIAGSFTNVSYSMETSLTQIH